MRTQTRRNVVRGAVVLGVGGALSACAGGAAGPGGGAAGDGAAGPTAPLKGQIKLSVWGAVYEDELYTAHYIPEIQALHPEIKVEFIRPAGDYRQFLEVAHAGGDAPDVMRQGAGDAGHYVRSNMDIPLDDYLKREKLNREDFYPHHWPHLIYGGKTYGVPQDTNLQGAYVNRALYREAGLKLPDEGYSFEQLVQDAPRLTKKSAAGTQQYALATGYGIGMLYPLVFAQGARVWRSDEKTELQLASEPFLRAAEFYKRALVEPGTCPARKR